PQPASPLFPYTTLFRSGLPSEAIGVPEIGVRLAMAVPEAGVPETAVPDTDVPETGVPAMPTTGVAPAWAMLLLLCCIWDRVCWTDRKSTRLNSSHSQIS